MMTTMNTAVYRYVLTEILCAKRHHKREAAATDYYSEHGTMVFIQDRPRAVNLHTVWDTAILLMRKGTTRVADYADKLNAQISPESAAEWAKGTPTDWANESHAVAVKSVYAGVPVDGGPAAPRGFPIASL